jgi:protein-tyrosine phosphatase
MPYRVLAVCTGNICRSPIAEVVLRDRLEAAGLGADAAVDSVGTSAEETGNPIDPRAARVLQEAGYAVPRRAARQVTPQDLADADLVLAMTSRHAARLRALDPGADVRMVRAFDPAAPSAAADAALDVEDPWYGDQQGFRTTLAQIEAAADAVVDHVRAALTAPRGPGR